MPLSLADVLSAQAGGGPVYEGGPDANVTPGSVLAALGLGGPSWLDAAQKQTGADIAAYQRGGVPELMADTRQTQELAGGFGGTTTDKGLYRGGPHIDAEIRTRLANSPIGSIDETIGPRSEHFYRFLTGNEYQDALKTGMLNPGPNSAGFLNFSEKPVAVYGASAWKDPGLLAEVPRENISKNPSARFYPGSQDSAVNTREPIPLSDASRVFGFQWPGGGMKASDITSLLYPQGIRAYHGSPYDFEKFDISKIGTGEGFQKYGHGLYFAENPAVAETYKATGFQAPPLSNKIGGSADLAIPPGKMYEVNINAEPGQFLNWDAPLSEQPAAVNKLRQLVTPNSMLADLLQQFELKNTTGQSAYHNIPNEHAVSDVMTVNNPNPQAASAALREAGIPGIRYLDQGSRKSNFTDVSPEQLQARASVLRDDIASGRGDTTRMQERLATIENELAFQNRPRTSNYVVFNPEIVDILKKYGLAGLTMGGVLTAAGQEPAPSQ